MGQFPGGGRQLGLNRVKHGSYLRREPFALQVNVRNYNFPVVFDYG
jgi:hypothetical protein